MGAPRGRGARGWTDVPRSASDEADQLAEALEASLSISEERPSRAAARGRAAWPAAGTAGGAGRPASGAGEAAHAEDTAGWEFVPPPALPAFSGRPLRVPRAVLSEAPLRALRFYAVWVLPGDTCAGVFGVREPGA